MNDRAVYDTMIFFQWAALSADRQHATIKALYDGSIRLVMSAALLAEVRDVLSRPELQARALNLSPERVNLILAAIFELAEWIEDVPPVFTWPKHPDDDHVFNLAIAANARYLVTWETRIHELAKGIEVDSALLRELAPRLEIVTTEGIGGPAEKCDVASPLIRRSANEESTTRDLCSAVAGTTAF